jgi:hypothetical protein
MFKYLLLLLTLEIVSFFIINNTLNYFTLVFYIFISISKS